MDADEQKGIAVQMHPVAPSSLSSLYGTSLNDSRVVSLTLLGYEKPQSPSLSRWAKQSGSVVETQRLSSAYDGYEYDVS